MLGQIDAKSYLERWTNPHGPFQPFFIFDACTVGQEEFSNAGCAHVPPFDLLIRGGHIP